MGLYLDLQNCYAEVANANLKIFEQYEAGCFSSQKTQDVLDRLKLMDIFTNVMGAVGDISAEWREVKGVSVHISPSWPPYIGLSVEIDAEALRDNS